MNNTNHAQAGLCEMPRGTADTRPMSARRPEIAESWHRSILSGVDPVTAMNDREIVDVDPDSLLARVSAPVLRKLCDQIAGDRFAVMLVDSDARMLRADRGCASLAPVLDRIGAVPGAVWTETATGTNALATPHETRKPIFIHGADHFVDALKDYSCYGAPIINPMTGRLEGVLDVMSDDAAENALMRPFIDQAVVEIQRCLKQARGHGSMALLSAFEAVANHPSSTVVAISRTMVFQNAAAAALLSAADLELLRSLAGASPGRSAAGLSLTLHSGTNATADIEPVPGTDGVVIRFRAMSRPIVPRSAKPVTMVEQSQSIVTRLRERAGRSAVLVGEPGTGRSTIAQAAVDGLRSCTISALALTGDDAEVMLRNELAATCHEVLVIDGLGLLSDRCLALVAGALETTRTFVLATSAEPAEGTEHARALSLFSERFTLRPLREQRHQLFEMISTVQPKGPRLQFDGASARVLTAYNWPGNLAELRGTVESLAHRLGGIVTLDDLPEHMRVGPSALAMTPWQRASCDAIVNALEMMRGNKAHAADFLGISRSALYHHLREYGLHA